MAVANAKRRRRRRRRFSGNFILTLGMLLLLAAAILTSLNFIEDGQAGEAAGNALEQLLLAERDARDAARRASSETSDEAAADSSGLTLDPVYLNDNTSTPEGEMPVIEIDGYGYIGVLQIPSLDLTLPVISDWSYSALQIAPCRYEGSAYGGMVIAGHNFDSHFGKLSQLEPGDEIRFVDLSGNTFTYAVAETEVLEATAIEEMVTGGWDLTLFTCTLSGQTRFTVRAALAGSGT